MVIDVGMDVDASRTGRSAQSGDVLGICTLRDVDRADEHGGLSG
jgi:hypothetical protein